MRTNSLILLALVLAFGAGAGYLFWLRFAGGDVFPPYSTLRADPVGAKAFATALERLGLEVERRYRAPAPSRPGDAPATWFLIGTRDQRLILDRAFARRLRDEARHGSRVVVALYPATVEPDDFWSFPDEPDEDTPLIKARDGEKRALTEGERAAAADTVPISSPAGWRCAIESDTAVGGCTEALLAATGRTDLPPTVRWHSRLYFDRLGPGWRTLYTCAGKPVLIERAEERGTLVLIADSFFLSNELLREARPAGLLAWLVGPHRRVVFDEHQLGVAEERGVMTLAREFGLGGGLLALLVLAGLFLWKNAVSFVPPAADRDERGDIVVERRDSTGLVPLLMRNVPRGELLRTCLAEWQRTLGRQAREAHWQEKINAAETRLAAEEKKPPLRRDLLGAYRDLGRRLDPR